MRQNVFILCVAFAGTMFASSAMNNVFVTYYMELFTVSSNVSSTAFYAGQVIFMLWNAVNDPLFGWLSDNWFSDRRNNRSGRDAAVARRVRAIQWGGLLWAAAFALTWWPPARQASAIFGFAHFLVSLCVYDAALTFVEVNHGALLAELTTSERTRAKMTAYAAVASAAGTVSSYAAHAYWDVRDLAHFRVLTLVLAGMCATVFWKSATAMLPPGPVGPAPTAVQDQDSASVDVLLSQNGQLDDAQSQVSPDRNAASLSGRMQLLVRQLFSSRNFVVYAVFASLQSFDCAYEKNFFATTLDVLVGDYFTTSTRALVISMSFLLPHGLTLLAMPAVSRVGVVGAVAGLLHVRLVLLTTAWVLGPRSPTVAAAVVLFNRVASEGMCRLFPLVVSGLVDEDAARFKRDRSVSATIVGTAAFLSKFGQSLAPMLGHAVLSPLLVSDQGTSNDLSGSSAVAGSDVDMSLSGAPERSALEGATGNPASTKDAVWWMLLVVASGVVLLQRGLWLQYSVPSKAKVESHHEDLEQDVGARQPHEVPNMDAATVPTDAKRRR